jgi:hypothetical protein
MHSPGFECGIIKLLKGQEEQLTASEHAQLQAFKKENLEVDIVYDDDENQEDLLQRLKRSKIASKKVEPCMQVSYQDMSYIEPTSNCCERLFSQANLTFQISRQQRASSVRQGESYFGKQSLANIRSRTQISKILILIIIDSFTL